MKTWKKTVGSLLLSSGVCFSAVANGAVDPWVNGVKSSPLSWLYAIEIDHAKLKHLGGENYELTIPKHELQSVLTFSDRPNRVARILTPKEYSVRVHTGADSFDVDPPNVVLAWKDDREGAQAYTIDSFSKGSQAKTLRYQLSHIEATGDAATKSKNYASSGRLVMFIDNSNYTFDQCMANDPSPDFITKIVNFFGCLKYL